MKTTFKELMEIRKDIILLYGKAEEINTKLEASLLKWFKSVDKQLSVIQSKYLEKFEEEKSEIEINNAFEKDGILVKNEKGEYQFSKEGERNKVKNLIELAKKINSECNLEEIEFEPYLIDLQLLKEEDEEIISLYKNILIK